MRKKQLLSVDFQSLFESAPGLYLILLPDNFEIAAVSDAYLDASMTKREEILGRGLFDISPYDTQSAEISDLRHSLTSVIDTKTVHTLAVQKYNTRKPDGTFEERFRSLLNKPVLNSDEEVAYIIHSVEDITQFILVKKEQDKNDKLTETLRKLNEDLEKKVAERTAQLLAVNKELESFSYSVSHDLRAPLRAIDGYAKMIEEDYSPVLDEEGKRLLSIVQYNAQKMGILIDDLLSFSRLGKKEILATSIDMTELTESVLGEISKSMEYTTAIKIGKLHSVKADYSLMSQVMLNLILNGIKYSSKKEKPEVEITSSVKREEITYAVRDNGAGFDMKYANKLFGVFQRLHSTEEFEGTGVGLAIVQRIINKHGGKVWAEGKVGEGATFYFTLPVE